MRIFLAMLWLPIFAFVAGTNAAFTINVMPLPASVEVHSGRLKLDGTFSVGTSAYTDARLEAAILRIQQRLKGRTGIVLPLGVAASPMPATLTVAVKARGEQYPKLGEDESYSLKITGDQATLSANTVVGAMRGMETLLQLVSGDAAGYYFPAIKI